MPLYAASLSLGPRRPEPGFTDGCSALRLCIWRHLAGGAADPLFGFRVYPLEALVRAFGGTGGARRYDFDPEIAVRLAWAGTPKIDLEAECRYLGRELGGVSHFRYVRDNLNMVLMHTRLICALLFAPRNSHPA